MSKARQLDPWEPDPKWHKARVEAFSRYRDMGADRSLAKLARALGKSKQLVSTWSKENNWVERTAAWDAECDRVRREEFADTSAALGEQLATDAEKLRAALLLPAKAAVKRITEAHARGEDPFAGVSNAEIIRLSATAGRAFAQVAHVERLAHGQSTENLGGHDGQALVGADVADKSPEAIEAYLTGRADAIREREEEKADA